MLLTSGATSDIRPLIRARPDIFGALHVPKDGNSVYELGRWAGDNGAYTGFDRDLFLRMLKRHQWARDRCLFVAAPDVVGNAKETMGLFWEWEPQIRAFGYPVALVAQDGLDAKDDATTVPWRMVDALFIGGTTGWKLSQTAAHLIEQARVRGKWVHMGRVNTRRRLQYAAAIGVDSVDGSGWSKWPKAMLERHGSLLRTLSEQRRLFLSAHPHWRAVN